MDMHVGFPLRFGIDLYKEILDTRPDALVVSMPEILEAGIAVSGRTPKHVFPVTSLEENHLKESTRNLGNYPAVIGFGGGTVADTAKYIHSRHGMPLIQVPSILSVDAFFTHEIAIRRGGVVHYIDDTSAEEVLIDYDILRAAPRSLNLSGLGDIISCHTGLFDWKLASDAGREPVWSEEMAASTQEILVSVDSDAGEFAAMSDDGIRTLASTLNWVGHYCYELGHPRFEEGSEHHFVYNLEYLTGRKYVHGQAVALGVIILSTLQNNGARDILDLIRRVGIDTSLTGVGATWEEVEETLRTLKSFVLQEDLPYTILHEQDISEGFIRDIRRLVVD